MSTDNLGVRIAAVALAGAVGSLARWGITRGSHAILGDAWPYGTLVVNVLGCFFFGFVWAMYRQPTNEFARLVLLTGFAGTFTTFSTFAFDTYELGAAQGELAGVSLLRPALNIVAHVGLGLLALGAGLIVGRQ